MKRVFDIVFSLIILSLFLPIGIIIAIFILITSSGGVFYIQNRVGCKGHLFGLIKFRTMKEDADLDGSLTVGMKDKRITKVGYLLRKLKLDEFPQFLNVLKNDMSVVGPRPEVKEFVDLYDTEQIKVLDLKPGITDYASLAFFNENEILGNSADPRMTYIRDVMPAKLKLNLQYIEKSSIGGDIKIVWKTFIRIFS